MAKRHFDYIPRLITDELVGSLELAKPGRIAG
jgi:hypothetical protein